MSREENPDFYTQKGYQLRNHTEMTGAMEDYLEMICRQSLSDGYVRINFLAGRLNVRPSSASKMVYQLRDLGYVAFEKYGLSSPPKRDGPWAATCSTGTTCFTAFSVWSTAPRMSWSRWNRWSTTSTRRRCVIWRP